MIPSYKSFLLHIFIQWLADKNVLNEWMEEIIDESNGFSLKSRIGRLNRTYGESELVYLSFGHTNSKLGSRYWINIQTDWNKYYNDNKETLKEYKGKYNATLQ